MPPRSRRQQLDAPAERRSQRAIPKIQRWIDLLAALLRHHYGRSLEQLQQDVPAYAETERKDTLQRMFERDKKELREFGIPIETELREEGESAVYRLRARDFYLPYLSVVGPTGASTPRRVTREGYRALPLLAFPPEELGLLAEAAARARQLGDAALAADAESALRKLAHDLPMGATDTPDDTVLARPRSGADPSTLVELGRALRRRKIVHFDYASPGRDVQERRSVEPFGLFFLNGHWYLAARDIVRDALRNFRVSRVAALEVNRGEASPDFEVPPSFSLAEHARSRQAWELGDGEAEEAVVEFTIDTGATAAAAELGEAIAGAPSRRRFRVRRRDTFARWLLSFAGAARPVEPEELVREYRRIAAETLAVYAEASA